MHHCSVLIHVAVLCLQSTLTPTQDTAQRGKVPGDALGMLKALEGVGAPCQYRLRYRAFQSQGAGDATSMLRDAMSSLSAPTVNYDYVAELLLPFSAGARPSGESDIQYLGVDEFDIVHSLSCDRQLSVTPHGPPDILRTPEVQLSVAGETNLIVTAPNYSTSLFTPLEILSPLPLSTQRQAGFVGAHWSAASQDDSDVRRYQIRPTDAEVPVFEIRTLQEHAPLPDACIEYRQDPRLPSQALFVGYATQDGHIELRGSIRILRQGNGFLVFWYELQQLTRKPLEGRLTLPVPSSIRGVFDETGPTRTKLQSIDALPPKLRGLIEPKSQVAPKEGGNK